MKAHVPKVDTGDDFDFMCGTCAFGAVVSARQLCMSCVKKTLEIVDLLSQAYDELNASIGATVAQRKYNARLARLMKRIDKVLGNRPTVDWPEDRPEAL